MTGHFLDQDFSANVSASGYPPTTGGTAPMQSNSTAVNQGYPAPVYPQSSGTHGQTFDGGQLHPKPACAGSQHSHGQQSNVGNPGQYGGSPLQAHQSKGENASYYNSQGAIEPPIRESYPLPAAQQHQYIPPPNQGYDIADGRQPQPQGYPSTHEPEATRPHVPGQYPPHGAHEHHHPPPHDQGYGVTGEYQHQPQEYPPRHFENGALETHIPRHEPQHHPPPHNQAHGGYEQTHGRNSQQPYAQSHAEHGKEKHDIHKDHDKKDKKHKEKVVLTFNLIMNRNTRSMVVTAAIIAAADTVAKVIEQYNTF